KPPEVRKKPLEPRPVTRAAPTVRLAQLPPSSAKSPIEPPKPAEPAPQKPDLKLPVDVVRASKAGTAKPRSDHVKKAEERRRTDEQVNPGKRGPAPVPPPMLARGNAAPLSKESRERKRGGGKATPGGGDGEDLGSALGGREARQLNRK